MITRRLLIPFVCVVVGLAGRPAAADPAQDAQTFINDFSHRAIESLTEKNLSDAELIRRFKTLFEEGFDISYIARSALGRFWPRATDDEKAQYVPLFEDYVVTIYAGQFRDYTGQGFTTKSAQVGADGVTIVFSDIVSSDGPPTKLEWIIGDVDGKPKIRDIKIEGVSMITTYRDQFANEILQHDGKIGGLIDALREKTASLHANNG
ncbi:MAG: ABC transporter substrate-binding protein [Alphaproteobacteria bacterium]